MTRRRVLFAVLVVLSTLGMLGMMAMALRPGGWTATDIVVLLAFLVTLPWLAVGFWNGLIGLIIDLWAKSPLRCVNPQATDIDLDAKLTMSTAVLLCIRNEDPSRLVRNLDLLAKGLIASEDAHQFHVYVLSDTTDAQIARQEALAFEQLRQDWHGHLPLTYRRRETNEGFKAGNIQDFCQRWGSQHELALTLDADSLMSAPAVRRLVLMMQTHPNLGIIQGLVVGLPTTHAFARLFQFGMRLGMRSYTLGSAWWQGECGPYWGHNAVIRLAPFMQACKLPVWPNGKGGYTHILSHDQIEAVLMCRAGYEVRVYPVEDDSFEENPPNLADFVARDLRWCAGNMQYWRFLWMPGLKLASRMQLLLAMLMFVGAPAWLAILGLLGWQVHQTSLQQTFELPWLGWLLLTVAIMTLLPKLASAISVLARPERRRSFGGGGRFLLGFALETIFSWLITPVVWLSQTLLLVGLPFGRRITWSAQNRDGHEISWLSALRLYGVHSLAGLVLAWLWISPQEPATWLVAYFIAGLWVAIPVAVLSSQPKIGLWLQHWRIAGIPEEFGTSDGSRCQLTAVLTLSGDIRARPSLDSSR
jgi:membrane glycosyltransferase